MLQSVVVGCVNTHKMLRQENNRKRKNRHFWFINHRDNKLPLPSRTLSPAKRQSQSQKLG